MSRTNDGWEPVMKVDELLSRARDSLEARKVYTEPYEKDGITVIAAAIIAGGGGGGTGRDEKGQEGDGAGFGLIAKPAGAFIIKDGQVRWEPATDVNRRLRTIGVIVVAVLLAVARIVKVHPRRTLTAD